MRKLIAVIGLGLALTATLPAQTTGTDATNLPPVAGTILDYLTTGSNYVFIPYTTIGMSKEGGFGGGLAIGYKATEVVTPVLRFDYFASQFWMGSLTAQLQVPRYLMGKIPVTPFAIAGGAMPFSGAGDQNHTIVTIVGGGLLAHLDFLSDKPFFKKSFVVCDYEQWIGLEAKFEKQVRVGWGISF